MPEAKAKRIRRKSRREGEDAQRRRRRTKETYRRLGLRAQSGVAGSTARCTCAPFETSQEDDASATRLTVIRRSPSEPRRAARGRRTRLARQGGDAPPRSRLTTEAAIYGACRSSTAQRKLARPRGSNDRHHAAPVPIRISRSGGEKCSDSACGDGITVIASGPFTSGRAR